MKRTGLLIVDLQEIFSPTPALVEAIRREAARHAVIVATRFINNHGSLFRTALNWHECGPNDPGTRMSYMPDDAIILEKTGYGLSATQVEQLKALGCDEWFLCGLETEACVMACAFTLWDAGIKPNILGELCQSTHHIESIAMARRQFG